MVNLDVYEDNVELKTITPCVPTFDTRDLSPIPTGSSDYNDLENKPSIEGVTLEGNKTLEELGAFSGDYNDLANKPDLFGGDYNDLTNKPTEISVANITNGSSSSTGLISGRRVKSAVEAFAPVRDVQVGGTSVVSGGVAEIPEIPELVTDLGVVDPSLYDDDVNVYFNTLTESGWYKFYWDSGDDYSYFAQVQAIEYGGATYVNQHCWGLEESPIAEWVRGLVIEDGEVVDEQTTSYMTFESASNTFATKTHQHYRVEGKSLSVWDYCDGNQINMQNGSPIMYTDILNSRQYVIETWRPIRQPVYIYQRVTDLIDCSVFYQRCGLYQSGRTTWGDWYKFTGTVFDPNGR